MFWERTCVSYSLWLTNVHKSFILFENASHFLRAEVHDNIRGSHNFAAWETKVHLGITSGHTRTRNYSSFSRPKHLGSQIFFVHRLSTTPTQWTLSNASFSEFLHKLANAHKTSVQQAKNIQSTSKSSKIYTNQTVAQPWYAASVA